jgi:hypothetical protein
MVVKEFALQKDQKNFTTGQDRIFSARLSYLEYGFSFSYLRL